MRKLLFILGATIILTSCEHTINNYNCKCDDTCCQPQDSTLEVQGSDVSEEQIEEVVTEEGGQ
jgi:hypothetical protein